MKVWLIYKMARGADVLREIRMTEKSARERVEELQRQNPHADGYYCEERRETVAIRSARIQLQRRLKALGIERDRLRSLRDDLDDLLESCEDAARADAQGRSRAGHAAPANYPLHVTVWVLTPKGKKAVPPLLPSRSYCDCGGTPPCPHR